MARAFAAAGMKVVLADAREEPSEQPAAELRDEGGRAIAVRTDVTRLDEVEAWARLRWLSSGPCTCCATTPA